MDAAIRCRELRKTYAAKPPVEALRGLELEVARGECFGLLGPNGAGKTTTIEILEGLLAPTSGEVEVLGLSWAKDRDTLREKLGVSLQETKFADRLTVEETLALFSSFHARGRPAEELLGIVELGEKRAAWTETLSGGQRQRLAVACALAGDPELVFLDEPTTGLDPQARLQLWEILRALKSRGRTIVISTHYMDEAEKLCDRVAIVDQGRVIALGAPAELIRSLGGEHVIEVAFEDTGGRAPTIDELRALPTVSDARPEGNRVRLNVGEPHRALPALLARAQEHGSALAHLSIRHASLEDVFVSLTGRHLRDE